MGAPSARTFEHARQWARLGNQVTVITGFPNHPTGIIRPEYRGSILKRESIEGIDLLRTWVYVTPNKGFTRRILNFLSFFASSLFFGTFMTKRPDVVIGTSPQFLCAVAAYLLSCLKRAPFVFEVRDIWPESAVELGALRNPTLIRVLEAIELFLYRRAALIVPVARSTRDYLIEKGISPEKICVIPNGIDASYLSDGYVSASNIRSELGLEGKFVVSYIGTHGMSHALEVVLEAGRRMSDEDDVRFLLVGEGAEKSRLKRIADQMGLRNLTFIDQQSRARLMDFYEAINVGLVPLRRLPIFTRVLPSKLFELMGAGRPIICSVEGEAAALVRAANAGICIEPENADALVAAVRQLRDDRELAKRLGSAGREFVEHNYLRSVLAEEYLAALDRVVGTSSAATLPGELKRSQK
jgi:glycosyltransferase involved in cell wall biosynthesis